MKKQQSILKLRTFSLYYYHYCPVVCLLHPMHSLFVSTTNLHTICLLLSDRLKSQYGPKTSGDSFSLTSFSLWFDSASRFELKISYLCRNGGVDSLCNLSLSLNRRRYNFGEYDFYLGKITVPKLHYLERTLK